MHAPHGAHIGLAWARMPAMLTMGESLHLRGNSFLPNFRGVPAIESLDELGLSPIQACQFFPLQVESGLKKTLPKFC